MLHHCLTKRGRRPSLLVGEVGLPGEMPSKYLIPKALEPAPIITGSSPGHHRGITGVLPGYYHLEGPALQWAIVLHFQEIEDRIVLIETVHGNRLHDYIAATPGTPLLGVPNLTNLARQRLMFSFRKQDTGDHKRFKLTGAVYQYLKRHGADVGREDSKVRTRYHCTCSTGFTRVYRIPGADPKCQKCGLSTGLTVVECKL